MSGKNQNRPSAAGGSAAGGGAGWHGGVAGGCISECEVHLFGYSAKFILSYMYGATPKINLAPVGGVSYTAER